MRLWSGTPLAARRSLLTEQSLLALRVADISCGSGHILLAAARRIATELAIVRTGEEQPSPEAFRAAVRDVIRQCIYGVDLNPLAVDLCKVALWLEAHNPGQPLNFLDHHIKCGNAIVGYARREDVERGVPDEAFKRLPDDDKDIAAALRKRNKAEHKERKQQKLDFTAADKHLSTVLQTWREIAGLPEKTPDQIAAKKKRYEDFVGTADAYLLKQILAIPIAQFYIPKTDPKKCITDADFRRYWSGQRHPQGEATATAWATASRKKFFHWFLEFPDVFASSKQPAASSESPLPAHRSPLTPPGFDVILGNPPYLGDKRLSGAYGHSFCEYVKWKYAPTGISDLVAYFVRRIYNLLRPGGFTAFITTNSIKDGDIRKDGLEQIIAQGGSINMAVRGIKWPGTANLVVSLVAINKGDWNGFKELDGEKVEFISAFFDDNRDLGEPIRLTENLDYVSTGTYFLGDGFLITHEEGSRLIEEDQKNEDVISPIINGQEINSDPQQQPGRSIINFAGRSLQASQRYDLPFALVTDRVKPERDKQKDRTARENWWLFMRSRDEAYRKITPLKRCFASARTTKHLSLSVCPTNWLFTDAINFFLTDRWDFFTVVQSTIHEIWARKYSGALKQDLRYSPSKCFDTFPFPAGQWHADQAPPDSPLAARCSQLARLGEAYHEHRRALMQQLWLGLTSIYNLFHDPEVSSERRAASGGKSKNLAMLEKHLAARNNGVAMDEAITGLLELRRLHTELDTAVRDAYGWTDLDLGHDFVDVDTLPENDRTRYTITPTARKELLTRLLAENHKRAAEQATKLPKPKPTKSKGRKKTDDGNMILIDLE